MSSPIQSKATSGADVSQSFSCEDRSKYISEKLKSRMTQDEMLEFIAKEHPQILIVGNKHNIHEEWQLFLDYILPKYKALNPSLDCFFNELPPNKLRESIFNEGRSYYISHNKSYEAGMQSFAKDKGLPFEIYNKDVAAQTYTFKIGEEYVYTVDLDPFYKNGINFYNIDDRSDISKRDDRMSQYAHDLFTSGKCHGAIAFLGMAHLAPQKSNLNGLGMTNFTLALDNLNPYKIEHIEHVWDNQQGKIKDVVSYTDQSSALDDYDCKVPRDPNLKGPFAFLTRDQASPLVDSTFPVQMKWGDFDSHLIMSVGPIHDDTL